MIKRARLIIISLMAVLCTVPAVVSAEQWQGPEHVLAAAKAGDPEAQLEMGILYEYGFFMTENKAPALAWYSLAAEQGNVRAAELRDRLQATMSSDEIRQAEEMKPTLAVPVQPAPQQAPETAMPETTTEATTSGTMTTPAETPAESETSAPEVTAVPSEQPEQPASPAPSAPADGIPTIK